MPTYKKSTNNGYELIVRSTLLSQDVPNNRSRVETRIQIRSIFARAFNSTVTGKMVSNGSTLWSVSRQQMSLSQGVTRTLATVEQWVNHNNDGTKAVAVRGEFKTDIQSGTWAFPSTTVTGTHTLPRIPRGPRVRHNGVWRNTMIYVRDGGRWRQAICYVRHASKWRQAGG